MSSRPITQMESAAGQIVPLQAPHIWINGQIFSEETARVSVLDRGFLYGDSVFETIRTYAKRPFALSEHLERLFESAARVWIEPPINLKELELSISQALEVFPLEEAYLRLMFTRGQSGLGLMPHAGLEANFVMILAPLVCPASVDYQQGIAAISLLQQRPQDGTTAAGAKIGNYLPAVLAYREAKKHDAKEALFVDQNGSVAEGATSNIFWVKHGTLATPPLAAGILDGITRRYVLKSALSLGLPVAEKYTSLPELKEADELFISSSIREIMPVTRLDGQAIGDSQVGAMTQALRQRFAQFTHELI